MEEEETLRAHSDTDSLMSYSLAAHVSCDPTTGDQADFLLDNIPSHWPDLENFYFVVYKW